MPKITRRSRASTFILIALGLALAAVTSWHALVMSARVTRPAMAMSLDPSEPTALTTAARALFAQAQAEKRPPPQDAFDLARKSLKRSPLNPVALRLLALPDGLLDTTKLEGKFLALSDRVTRRDLGTQMLRIQDAGNRRDISGVLDAYNKAMTTKESSWSELFPPLTQIMKLPEGRKGFAYFLDLNPPWLSPFFQFALNQVDNPRDYYEILIVQNRLDKLRDSRAIQNVLINALVARGDWAEARKTFLYHGLGSESGLTSVSLDEDTLGNGENTLYWFFAEASGRNAVPFGGRFLSVAAEPGRSGVVAQKVLFLAPGKYRLATSLDAMEPSSPVSVEWIVQCLSDETGAANETGIERRRTAEAMFDEFTVGPGCDAQRLLLNARGAAAAQTGGEVVIEDIELKLLS